MYALFLILNDTSRLHDIQEIFYAHSAGATTIDSCGMGKVLMEHHENVPLLKSVRKLLEGDKPYNKTVISVIKDDVVLDKIIGEIKERLGGLDEAGTGFMFTIPVAGCYGFKLNEK